MLESHRERYFFRADSQLVIKTLRATTGDDGKETTGPAVDYRVRLSDPTGGKRFMTATVRSDGDMEGNVTVRWRDEPGGTFENQADDIHDRLDDEFELLSLAEARQQSSD